MSRGPSGTLIEMPVTTGGEQPARRRDVRPYRFPNLDQIPRSQLQLLKQLGWLLPEGLLSGELSAQAGEQLRGVFDEDVHLWLDYVHTVAPPELPRILREPTFLGVIAPSPHRARGLIEVELVLAHAIIDQLLGASGEASILRPLTDIEVGVLSYVLLQTLAALSPHSEEQSRPRMRLEGAVGSLEEGLALFEQERDVAVIEFKALIGAAAGYLRFLIPGSAVFAAARPEETPEFQARQLERIERNLPRLGAARAWLRTEIGEVELTGDDIVALRAGDVMLVDSLTTRSDRGEAGRAQVRVGMGKAGFFEAALELVEGKYRATLEGFEAGPEPIDDAPDDEAAAKLADPEGAFGLQNRPAPPVAPPPRRSDAPTSPGATCPWDDDEKTAVSKPLENPSEAAELLNDVPLKVVVELARIPVTATEILGLHTGQILELGKGPGEPVELSVNGKVVARGELVEVEGQLGVRIASLS